MDSIKYYLSIIKNVYYFNFKFLFNKLKFKISDAEKKILEELRKNGVAIVPDFYSSEECNQLKEEVDINIEKYDKKIWRDKVDSDNRIFGAEEISEKFKRYHNNDFVNRMASLYLKSEVLNLSTLVNRTTYKLGNTGSGDEWHRDTPYRNQFKSVVYLDDVTTLNGPFTYFLGSHYTTNSDFVYTKGIKKYDYRLNDDDFLKDVETKGFLKKEFTAKKGTLLFIDTKGIHKGASIKEGKRYTMFNYFLPKNEFTKNSNEVFNKLKVTRK